MTSNLLSIRLLTRSFRLYCDSRLNSVILLRAIKEKLVLAVLLTILMFFLTPVMQSFNTSLAFEIWFRDLYQKPLNSILYVVFSILFGIFISLYLYSRKNCTDCKIKPGGKSGFTGSVIGFMIGVCPACFSFIAFLIPLSASIFLTTFAPIFLMVSIGIILHSIYSLGRFKSILVNKEIKP